MFTGNSARQLEIQFVPRAYADAGARFAAILWSRFAPIVQLLAWRGTTNCLATRAPSFRVPMKYPG